MLVTMDSAVSDLWPRIIGTVRSELGDFARGHEDAVNIGTDFALREVLIAKYHTPRHDRRQDWWHMPSSTGTSLHHSMNSQGIWRGDRRLVAGDTYEECSPETRRAYDAMLRAAINAVKTYEKPLPIHQDDPLFKFHGEHADDALIYEQPFHRIFGIR